jgi:Mor family transcriptional regulator
MGKLDFVEIKAVVSPTKSIFKKLNIKLRNNEIFRLHKHELMTLRDIACRFDISFERVRQILKDHFNVTRDNKALSELRAINNSENIIRDYNNGVIVKHIERKYKVSYKAIYKILNDNGIPRRKNITAPIHRLDLKEIVDTYNRLGMRKCAEELKCDIRTLKSILVKNNIEIKRKYVRNGQ